jgi:hypothetical protein
MMTLREFVKAHREAIDRRIMEIVGKVPASVSCYTGPDGREGRPGVRCPKSGTLHYHPPARQNDGERALFVQNDEALYLWARSEGVRA